jgi:hypothetical protein
MSKHNYAQEGGPLQDIEPGKRIREANPGSRIREALGQGDGDVMQGTSISIPDNPGPSAAGRTPVIGTLRRQMGAPVVRDQLPDLME